jgi:hypothetical protein
VEEGTAARLRELLDVVVAQRKAAPRAAATATRARLLLDADPTRRRPTTGQTALRVAARECHRNFAEVLVEGSLPAALFLDVRGHDGKTARGLAERAGKWTSRPASASAALHLAQITSRRSRVASSWSGWAHRSGRCCHHCKTTCSAAANGDVFSRLALPRT